MLKFQLRFSQNRVFRDRPLQFSTAQLIPTIRMERGHSVEGPVGYEFSSSYTVRELSPSEVGSRLRFYRKGCLFGKKRPLAGRFLKFRSERIHRDTVLCANVVKFWPTGSRWNRSLLTSQKISPRSLASAPIAPKICQSHRKQCTQSAPNFI